MLRSTIFYYGLHFFNTKVSLIFLVNKMPYDSDCNVASDVISAWWPFVTSAPCITPSTERGGGRDAMTIEPPHDKTNKMACAPSEDSDQAEHQPSLIRDIAARSMDS